MNGGAIFDFTADIVPSMVEELLLKSNLKQEDVDLYVFHQANKYMINYLRKLLDIDKEKFYIFMEKVGNTVSSTIPIALCEAKNDGKLQGNVMLAGFGVGLSWGATMLTIQK
jgi:3-oxoacyl-[acyl-carrier-protein] synthase-3